MALATGLSGHRQLRTLFLVSGRNWRLFLAAEHLRCL
jgi:hypothetical protein